MDNKLILIQNKSISLDELKKILEAAIMKLSDNDCKEIMENLICKERCT